MDIDYTVPESVQEFDLNAAGKGATSPKEGACLNEAIYNIVYRVNNAAFRANTLAVVEIITGVVRERKPKLDSEGKPVTAKQTVVTIGADGKEVKSEQDVAVTVFKDTEAKYFGKVCAQLDVEEEHFQKLGQLVVDGVGAKNADGKFEVSKEGRDALDNVLLDFELVDITDENKDKVLLLIGEGVPFDASQVEREAPQPKKTGKAFLEAADSLIKAGQGEVTAAKLAKILGTEVTSDRESLGKAIQLWDARKRQEEKKQLAAKVSALA